MRHAWTKREINVRYVFLVSPKKFPVFVTPSMRALSNQPPGPLHQKQPTQAVSAMMKSKITFRSIQILILLIMGVFLSVNPKTDFRSKNGFRVPFGKSKSGFLIWWILFQKGFTGFEIRRIQIQINGLVIYAVPFTVDPKLARWASGISCWSIPIEAVEFPRCCHLPQNIWKH